MFFSPGCLVVLRESLSCITFPCKTCALHFIDKRVQVVMNIRKHVSANLLSSSCASLHFFAKPEASVNLYEAVCSVKLIFAICVFFVRTYCSVQLRFYTHCHSFNSHFMVSQRRSPHQLFCKKAKFFFYNVRNTEQKSWKTQR